MLRLKLISERGDSHRILHALRLLRVAIILQELICSTAVFILAFVGQYEGVGHVGALVLGPHVEEVMRGIELFRVGRPTFLRSETTLIWRIASSLAPGPLDALSRLLLVATVCADQGR